MMHGNKKKKMWLRHSLNYGMENFNVFESTSCEYQDDLWDYNGSVCIVLT